MPNKTLLLLRHAKSERTLEVVDLLRPLKKRGERDAKTIGEWLVSNDLQPELILSSPAERALRTAKKACKAMGLNKEIIQTDEGIYNATPAMLKAVLHKCPPSIKRVMLVGHNPSLEELLADLVKTPVTLPDDGKLMPTAALAELQFSAAWSKLDSHCANLVRITLVKTLYISD